MNLVKNLLSGSTNLDFQPTAFFIHFLMDHQNVLADHRLATAALIGTPMAPPQSCTTDERDSAGVEDALIYVHYCINIVAWKI